MGFTREAHFKTFLCRFLIQPHTDVPDVSAASSSPVTCLRLTCLDHRSSDPLSLKHT